MREIRQNPEVPKAPQGRPRWELVKELKRAASGTSTDFWVWWWAMDKASKRVLLDEAAEVAA